MAAYPPTNQLTRKLVTDATLGLDVGPSDGFTTPFFQVDNLQFSFWRGQRNEINARHEAVYLSVTGRRFIQMSREKMQPMET